MPDPSIIISLLGLFRTEKQTTSSNDFNKFLEWLINKKHKNLVEEINSNHHLSQKIKSLLQDNHDEIMKTLSSVDDSLSSLAAKEQNSGGLIFGATASNGSEISLRGKGQIINARADNGSKIVLDEQNKI